MLVFYYGYLRQYEATCGWIWANSAYVSNQPRDFICLQLADDVAEFINTAQDGVVIFSFGTHVESMTKKQAQMFADSFAMLPQRVLWQSSADLSQINVRNNTKIVRWVPLAQLMSNCTSHFRRYTALESEK